MSECFTPLTLCGLTYRRFALCVWLLACLFALLLGGVRAHRLGAVVKSRWFNLSVAMLVLINTVFLAVQTDAGDDHAIIFQIGEAPPPRCRFSLLLLTAEGKPERESVCVCFVCVCCVYVCASTAHQHCFLLGF